MKAAFNSEDPEEAGFELGDSRRRSFWLLRHVAYCCVEIA